MSRHASRSAAVAARADPSGVDPPVGDDHDSSTRDTGGVQLFPQDPLDVGHRNVHRRPIGEAG
jgi:hypothetical protein